jgi:anaerobic selenocysteine-containing dehydrogenase
VFGAGGGTSSYEETRAADLILLWGWNAREAHPIFSHHVLKAIHAGAKLIVVDPRRTASAQSGDLWLGLAVGTDIPLANAVAREILEAGYADLEFIDRATSGFSRRPESHRFAGLRSAAHVRDLRLRAGISTFELFRHMGTSLAMIDRHYGHLARDGRQYAIRLLVTFRAPEPSYVHAVDAGWTLKEIGDLSSDNGKATEQGRDEAL